MSATPKELLIVESLPSTDPSIGRALWRLEDGRHDTMHSLQNLTPAILNWTAAPNTHSIGTLIYHITQVEMGWLHGEVLELRTMPPALEALFPLESRDEAGSLTLIRDMTPAAALHLLETTRTTLLAAFRDMPLEEFRRLHLLPDEDYDVTPEWVLHHLTQHEAEHRAEIAALRVQATHALAQQ